MRFAVSILATAALFLLVVMIYPQASESWLRRVADTFRIYAGNLVIQFNTLAIIICLIIAASPIGSQRIGNSSDPKFGLFSWFAMLFATGMGAGLLFWGAAEPLTHYQQPVFEATKQQALGISMFHWGMHPWSIYALAALITAYFGVKPSAFLSKYPYLKKAVDGLIAVSLLLAVAASLVQGIQQIEAGFRYIDQMVSMLAIGLVVIIIYCLSVATPLRYGIQWLSRINIILAFLLLVLFVDQQFLSSLKLSLKGYMNVLPKLSFHTIEKENWSKDWTVTYLLSWIAWAPLTGIFISRISQGRSVRQVILGVIGIPTVFTLIWFSVFGSLAIADNTAGLEYQDVLYHLIDERVYLQYLTILCIAIFLITSADSASYVIAEITEDTDGLRSTKQRRLLWGITLGIFTVMLITIGGSVQNVRALFSVATIAIFLLLMLQTVLLLYGLCGKRQVRFG